LTYHFKEPTKCSHPIHINRHIKISTRLYISMDTHIYAKGLTHEQTPHTCIKKTLHMHRHIQISKNPDTPIKTYIYQIDLTHEQIPHIYIKKTLHMHRHIHISKTLQVNRHILTSKRPYTCIDTYMYQKDLTHK